jgi:glycosyltransferase involved in cell wall biosynthesis
MAMEIPVVTTNLSGIPELVDSGVTGFLVEPEDAKALAEKMAQLLDDYQLRQNMGRRGREKVLQDYDQAKNHASIADILCKAMKKMGVSPLLRQEEGRTVGESAAAVET